jgi:hypothetical protein
MTRLGSEVGIAAVAKNVEAAGSNIQRPSVNAGRFSNVHQIAAFAGCAWVPEQS